MELHYRKAVIITKLLKNTVLEAEKKRRSGEKPERKLIPPIPRNARRTANPTMQRKEDVGALRPRWFAATAPVAQWDL